VAVTDGFPAASAGMFLANRKHHLFNGFHPTQSATFSTAVVTPMVSLDHDLKGSNNQLRKR
jgi:hypothetical protein